MKHLIIVKFKDNIWNREDAASREMLADIKKIFNRTKQIEGVHTVNIYENVTPRPNRHDLMIDYTTGQPHTAHTTNPVPFILVNYDPAYTLKEGGCLADIVPTLINVMGMEQPAEMTGKSLLIKK